MTHIVFTIRTAPACALALACLLPALPATSSTAIERQYEAQAAVPIHKNLAGKSGPQVAVHYVHSKGDYFAAGSVTKTMHPITERHLLGCGEAMKKMGWPSNPPAEFPDQYTHLDIYHYAAANRTIEYKREYGVGMAKDCSLIETVKLTAELHSAKGWCKIDLDRKTAQGECDATGHANAPLIPLPPTDEQMEANIKAMEADPRMRQSAAALRAFPKNKYGPKRTIAGHECQTVTALGGMEGCVSKQGGFVPTADGGVVTLASALAKTTLTAVEVTFDMPVNGAIFTPYLQGGYKITAGEAP